MITADLCKREEMDMNDRLSRMMVILSLLLVTGCAGAGFPKWQYFHGDLSGQGYQPVVSSFALFQAWVSKPYKITSSSPVIGTDVLNGKEFIYFGTVDGELVALNSDNGTEHWRRSLAVGDKIPIIVSSPAVSPKGDIYVVGNLALAAGRYQSLLYKFDELGILRWSFTFEDQGFTSGSPKILRWGDDTLIFIYVNVVIGGELQGQLFVLRDSGRSADLIDRKGMGSCHWGRAEQPALSENAFDSFAAVWDFISAFPPASSTGDHVLPDAFIDPTVAVFTGGKLPLIAVADNLCSIGVYEWGNNELSVVWRESHRFEKHSSPSLLTSGLMVLGRQSGKVLAYDVETGIKLWEYDAGKPVLATPAATPKNHIFIVSKSQIQVLNQRDGSLVYDGTLPRKVELASQTYASPAVSENCVYVSSLEMLTFSHDLSTRSQDTNFHGNGLASMALANNGALYVVASDGTIRKYLGAR